MPNAIRTLLIAVMFAMSSGVASAGPMRDQIWAELIAGFCKVDLVCYGSKPNWLDWVILICGGLFVAAAVINLLIGLSR